MDTLPGDPDRRWVARQPGFQAEIIPLDLKLPVNIVFVPGRVCEPGTEDLPHYYITELFGSIEVVTCRGDKRTHVGGDAQDPAQRPFSLLNFNPLGAFPGAGEQGVTGIVIDPVTARWTGTATPRFSQTYTFTTIADDGIRLWVNNELIVNSWTTQTAARRDDNARRRPALRHPAGLLPGRRPGAG